MLFVFQVSVVYFPEQLCRHTKLNSVPFLFVATSIIIFIDTDNFIPYHIAIKEKTWWYQILFTANTLAIYARHWSLEWKTSPFS